MNDITERERFLQARGDVALVALKSLLNTVEPMLNTNSILKDQLDKILERQTQTGTLLHIVGDVISQNVMILRTLKEQSAQTLAEVQSFVEQSGESVTIDTALENVIDAIRRSSVVYESKTDEEIKKLMGL